jgi:hypothetical protein
MNVQSVRSANQIYAQTTVAQQRVAFDRANVVESETQLSQNLAQLDKDLTYLANLQQKSHRNQHLEMAQVQTMASNRLEQNARSAQQFSQAIQQSLSPASSEESSVGKLLDVTA